MNVTFLGTSIEAEVFVTPPCSVTSTVARPPLNVLIVVDSPEAETRPIGTHEPTNKSITKTGERRRMLSPEDLNEWLLLHVPYPKLSILDINLPKVFILPACYLSRSVK